MGKSWIDKNLIAIPMSDVLYPKTGLVARVDYWWLEKDGHLYKTKGSNAFQCNKDRRVIDMVYGKLIKESGFSAIHIPVAYVEAR
ncbi:hypothetical protein [Klebsiella michiganensis]|uniref:hypothetical protein n=1 Tax=Klebsiella michiganensis TaxID=1134687 RepID=UPI003F4FA8DA